ncbi:NAD(P)-binding domain-containing protein [Sphingobacterium psychroaquaticum]|uniref:Predicted flavoprotein CzcO associated with the cation diffusion facilitator CzcD n=1 Tax=Sphingobacterium psychroaquaticum TaxID=561061 RepID=A0A1X7I6A7_9SPHI|nr:NAD(P)-binding domain-containing protein [Sphingobacterium psychroaquaticum]QBQ41906.1 FAD-dependent oxidoreductase [Sphingobacterium psychroaquaticum]SMG09630.1 Predicted flavoprotein CzcO associated with the cation diffusion facilitator CzcD [Sphingobacterium psychroaquaticum]
METQNNIQTTDSIAVSKVVPDLFYKVDIVVIGAGQAGLSAAYHLKRQGIEPGKGFVVLDDEFSAGGAWQHRWDSLTLSTVNGINDLPGLAFADVVNTSDHELQANTAIPQYYEAYEKEFELPVIRPIRVHEVTERNGRFIIRTNGVQFNARGIINATGTWKTPNCPRYPGWEKFQGRQLHTGEYKNAQEFIGKHVIIVGGGISAVQLLGEVSAVTQTTWVARRPPDFRPYKFTPELGRDAVALVEERVREGLPVTSVVSVTGLPITPAIQEMLDTGTLDWNPMFDEITETGVRWADGRTLDADVIFWNTGFRHSLDHLAALHLQNDQGGIEMSGTLATQVVKDPRIHLTGYGPSASTIGANRAGRAAAKELIAYLQL